MSSAEVQELHDSGLVWAGAYLATFAAGGGVLTLGLATLAYYFRTRPSCRVCGRG